MKLECTLTVSILGSALMFAGCVPQQSPTPSLSQAPLAMAPAKPKGPTGAEIFAEQPTLVRTIVQEHQPGTEWLTLKTATGVLYPYDDDAEVRVVAAPLRTVDIALEPGETVTDMALGDQQRWMTSLVSAGDPHNPTPHVVVKPEMTGMATDLTIYGTRHIYRIDLRSSGKPMRAVGFYYPDDLLAEMRAADSAQTDTDPAPGDSALPEGDPAALDFNYSISPSNVPWRPMRAFSDASRVYLQMPLRMKTANAPALLIDGGNGAQMVNYRMRNDYLVVDRLFDKAELISGAGRDQDKVTVTYTGGTR
jgi:type IV secretion system protein TrbG